MAHILIMPRQGNTVESCIITDWKIKEGDTVTAETPVCEVETDKASFEVPSGAAGKVLAILRNAGDDVPVLEPIAVIGETGENWQSSLGAISQEDTSHGGTGAQVEEKKAAAASLPNGDEKAAAAISGDGKTAISPRARNLAEKESLPAEMAAGTGPGGRIIERDIIAALENRPALTAAAKTAGGIIPQQGTGIGGRVTTADIASPIPHSPLPTPHSPLPTSPTESEYTETPIKGIRKIISDRMLKSLAESAQFTLNAAAPVSRLQEIRSRMKASQGFCGELGLSKITVNDLILFAVSRLLPRYPFMNAHKIGDTIKTFNRVHLGVAVDTPKGLMVPVIRNADMLSLSQISLESKRLSSACQNGSPKPDELSGSTFTVTNLGSLGITGFTPVLNAPEVAILGVCGIELKPVAQQKIETASPPFPSPHSPLPINFEPHISFSLTINHQVVDGAPAARFLKALCEAIADIDLFFAAG